MKYALNLEKDTGRILSACVMLPNGNYKGMPKVEELPEGDITDYRWEGEYIYDPSPKEEVEEQGATLEDRVADLEADSTDMKEALEMILSGVTE